MSGKKLFTLGTAILKSVLPNKETPMTFWELAENRYSVRSTS